VPKEQNWGLEIFTNFALLNGYYLQSENSSATGKKLELLAPITFKSGLNLAYKKIQLNAQISYTAAHYSDATNAELSATAVVGKIPSYTVSDISFSYCWRFLKFQAGINNLFNEMYFTRRASSYPGPGILPADGRNLYLGIRYTFSAKTKQ
jgi:Fe(3+) dicitrate transport protein